MPTIEQLKIKPLVWTEPAPPGNDCHYDHVAAETPFGRFLITWKGWKERPLFTIDEAPCNEWIGGYYTLQETKDAAEAAFRRRVEACFE